MLLSAVRFASRPTLCMIAAAATLAPATAQSARDILTQASFAGHDQTTAMRQIDAAQRAAATALRQSPGDSEATLMQAMSTGYHAKLTGSRGEAVSARKQFEALIGREPRNAEAHLALGAWHLGAVHKLGRMMGGAVLGARKPVGLASLDRAVALGGNHAFFSGLAALLRLEIDPDDQRGRALAETAARAGTPTALDRIMQRAAVAVLVPLRAGDKDAVESIASRHLPFGWLDAP